MFFPWGLTSPNVGPLPINHRGDSFFTVSPFLERGKGFFLLSLTGFCTGFPVYFTSPGVSGLGFLMAPKVGRSIFKVQRSRYSGLPCGPWASLRVCCPALRSAYFCVLAGGCLSLGCFPC